MGFSVSGATAVILIGGVIAFSFAFTAANNGFEQLSDAHDDRAERLLSQQNTGVEVASATYDADADRLTVVANNTGAAELSVERTTLLVDGSYTVPDDASVDGDGATDLWLPGEQLTLEATVTSQPDRVKVATETGVADVLTEVTQSG